MQFGLCLHVLVPTCCTFCLYSCTADVHCYDRPHLADGRGQALTSYHKSCHFIADGWFRPWTQQEPSIHAVCLHCVGYPEMPALESRQNFTVLGPWQAAICTFTPASLQITQMPLTKHLWPDGRHAEAGVQCTCLQDRLNAQGLPKGLPGSHQPGAAPSTARSVLTSASLSGSSSCEDPSGTLHSRFITPLTSKPMHCLSTFTSRLPFCLCPANKQPSDSIPPH